MKMENGVPTLKRQNGYIDSSTLRKKLRMSDILSSSSKQETTTPPISRATSASTSPKASDLSNISLEDVTSSHEKERMSRLYATARRTIHDWMVHGSEEELLIRARGMTLIQWSNLLKAAGIFQVSLLHALNSSLSTPEALESFMQPFRSARDALLHSYGYFGEIQERENPGPRTNLGENMGCTRQSSGTQDSGGMVITPPHTPLSSSTNSSQMCHCHCLRDYVTGIPLPSMSREEELNLTPKSSFSPPISCPRSGTEEPGPLSPKLSEMHFVEGCSSWLDSIWAEEESQLNE